MTPSGPNNQSFLLRIAPASPQCQVVTNINDYWWEYSSCNEETKKQSHMTLLLICLQSDSLFLKLLSQKKPQSQKTSAHE